MVKELDWGLGLVKEKVMDLAMVTGMGLAMDSEMEMDLVAEEAEVVVIRQLNR